jgi:uncharacterized protein (DUF3820 family)
VRFYLPYQGSIPDHPEDYWPWILSHPELPEGRFTWVLYTYLQLKAAGLQVELVDTLPEYGTVISHRDFLPASMLPSDLFLVCIKADRNHHPWAQFHLVQNEVDRGTAIDFWPQPGLKPRDPSRKGIRSIAYFGREANLTQELKGPWDKRFTVKDRLNWHDYSDVDVTISVRDFTGNSSDPVLDANAKPPNKLINSWRAGVPAIVGCESAFRQVRRSSLDFLEVQSMKDLREALRQLENPVLYYGMVENGFERAKEYTDAKMVARWREVFLKVSDGVSAFERQGFKRMRAYGRMLGYFLDWKHLRSIAKAGWFGERRR